MCDKDALFKKTMDRLNQYCQQRQITLPACQYHQQLESLEWCCVFSTADGRELGRHTGHSKKQARQLAAEKVLTALKQQERPRLSLLEAQQRRSPAHSTAILVDCESCPTFLLSVEQALFSDVNTVVFAFTSERLDTQAKQMPCPTHQTLVAMQMYAGYLLATELFDAYLVVTLDPVQGPALVSLISQCAWWPSRPALLFQQQQQQH